MFFKILFLNVTSFTFTCLNYKASLIVDVSKDISELKQDIDVQLHGEDQSWARNDSNVRAFPFFSR